MNSIFKYLLQVTLFTFVLGASHSVYAFKIEAHVWLAQQIWEELEEQNGAVMILGERYELESRIARIIKENRGAFVMGTLGADIYPDMLAGQMTTHPGVNEVITTKNKFNKKKVGWQTDDWLQFVLGEAFRSGKDENIAFAIGYMLHASMDMWAHTYVNTYTGDVFSILDNAEVAERHVAIEAYIKTHHETLYERIPPTNNKDAYSDLQVPAQFVRRTLILNDQAAEQYDQVPATFYLSAINAHWRGLRSAKKPLQNFIGHTTTQVVDHLRPALDRIKKAKTKLDEQETAFDKELERLADAAGQAAQTIANTGQSILAFTGVDELIESAGIEIELDAAAIEVKGLLDTALTEHRRAVKALSHLGDQALNPDVIEAQVSEALGGLSVAVIDNAISNLESAMDAYVEAWEETAKELMRPKGNRFQPGGDPVQPMKHWVGCWGPALGVPFQANLIGSTCSQVADELAEFQERYAALKQTVENVFPGVETLKTDIRQLDEIIAELTTQTSVNLVNSLGSLGPDGEMDMVDVANWLFTMWDKKSSSKDLNRAFQESNSSVELITKEVSTAVHKDLNVCAGKPMDLAKEYTDAPLRDFAPIQNAVTMSKLALLNPKRLNNLMARLDPGSVAANPKKHGSKNSATQNSAQAAVSAQTNAAVAAKEKYIGKMPVGTVLIGALRSIDGDRQWLPIAPPPPRAGSNNYSASDKECRRFGYPGPLGYTTKCTDKSKDEVFPFEEPRVQYQLNNRKGFLIAKGANREHVFTKLFDPVNPHVCEWAGKDSLAGIYCGTGPEFPDYNPLAKGIKVLPPASTLSSRRVSTTQNLEQRTVGRARAGSITTQATAPSKRLRTRGNRNAESKAFDQFSASANSHSWLNSYLLSLLSYISYPGAASPAPVREQLIEAELGAWGLELVAWESTEKRGKNSGSTQFLVAKNNSALFIAFRGSTVTFSDKGQDWVDNDLDFLPKPINAWGRGVVLHDGFADAAGIVFKQVEDIVKVHAGARKVWLTGHSLGGAVAVINGFNLKKKGLSVQGVYVYGAPPVGNDAWRRVYDAALPNTYRWSAQNDPVTSVMAQLPGPFEHVGKRNNLLANSKVVIGDSRELVYPMNKGVLQLVHDLSTTHMSYWCRLRASANSQSDMVDLPIPPNSECDLCRI